MHNPLAKECNSVQDILSEIKTLRSQRFIRPREFLFRGQSKDEPLVPTIARHLPDRNSERIERLMLQELKRRAYLSLGNMSDLDLMVYAQHHGMATRLLDWTANPLIAAWFACSGSERAAQESAFVYAMPVHNSNMADRKTIEKPLSVGGTKVYRPHWNNARVAAQQGMFTLHAYGNRTSRWIPIGENLKYGEHLAVFKINGASNIRRIIIDLDEIGINHESIFPGVEGTCRYISWRHFTLSSWESLEYDEFPP